MLTTALIVSSLLAIYQEEMYRDYGKHPREAMFYIVSLETLINRSSVSACHFIAVLCAIW
jgi:hypothetical protein